MGGLGSGGHNRRHYRRVEDCRRLDAAALQRQGVLAAGWQGQWVWKAADGETALIHIAAHDDRIELAYRYREGDGPWTPVHEAIALSWSPRRLGGAQPYFLCPDCARRVRIVYLLAARFRCRFCHGLVYASSQEGPRDRLVRRIQKRRRQLGADPGIEAPLPPRPKTMRQEAYDQLCKAIAADEAALLDDLWARLKPVQTPPDPQKQGDFWS